MHCSNCDTCRARNFFSSQVWVFRNISKLKSVIIFYFCFTIFCSVCREICRVYLAGLIGHICTTDDHCKILHSHCRRNVCICKDGYRIFGSTQCIPRVAKPKEKKIEKSSKLVELGDECDKLSLCQRGAICKEGVCSCPETFYKSDGVCVKNIAKIKGLFFSWRLCIFLVLVIVPPLSSCLNGEECSGNSECVHGMCFCKEDYTLYQGKCQRLKMVEKLRVLETTKKLINPNKQLVTPAPSQKKTTTTSTTTVATTTTTRHIIRPSTTTFPITTTTPSPLTPIKISMKLGPESSNSQTTPNPNYEYKWKRKFSQEFCLMFCASIQFPNPVVRVIPWVFVWAVQFVSMVSVGVLKVLSCMGRNVSVKLRVNIFEANEQLMVNFSNQMLGFQPVSIGSSMC